MTARRIANRRNDWIMCKRPKNMTIKNGVEIGAAIFAIILGVYNCNYTRAVDMRVTKNSCIDEVKVYSERIGGDVKDFILNYKAYIDRGDLYGSDLKESALNAKSDVFQIQQSLSKYQCSDQAKKSLEMTIQLIVNAARGRLKEEADLNKFAITPSADELAQVLFDLGGIDFVKMCCSD